MHENTFEENKEEMTKEIGELGDYTIMSKKGDYTQVEMDEVKTVIYLIHLLYEISKNWTKENENEKELEIKINRLFKQIDKLNQIAIEEAPKKKINVLEEISKKIEEGKSKKFDKELEKKGIDNKNISDDINDIRKLLEESKRKYEEALKRIEELYKKLEPVKEDWSEEQFLKSCIGEYKRSTPEEE